MHYFSKQDGIQHGGGGVRQRRDAEDRGRALSGRLPLPGVSGDLYGASDTSLHTHLLQGNTDTHTHARAFRMLP